MRYCITAEVFSFDKPTQQAVAAAALRLTAAQAEDHVVHVVVVHKLRQRAAEIFAVVHHIDILIMLREIISERIAVGVFDEQARAVVGDVVVYERAQREIACEEAHVLVVSPDLGDERLLIAAVGEGIVSSLIDIEMHVSGRDEAVNPVGGELAALVRLIVEAAVERLLHDLLILIERHRRKTRRFRPFRIGVPCAERRPVVVGAE